MYDVGHNSGFATVGIDHETAACAGESLSCLWKDHREQALSKQEGGADGGGSNGVRHQLWKQLATETGLAITVCYLPPATSTWNTIEHWLFSCMSIMWCGKPLTCLETIIGQIFHTTTEEG